MFLILDVAGTELNVVMAPQVMFVHQNEGMNGAEQAAAVSTDDNTDSDEEYFEYGDKGEGE